VKKVKYPVILFDLDGTLIDSMPDMLACMNEAYAKEGIFEAKPAREHIGPPLLECLKQITPRLEDSILERVADNFKSRYDTFNYPNTFIYPGVKETLKYLKNGKIKLYLVTNKRYVPALRILKILGLEYFEEVISPDINKGKRMNKTEMLACLVKKAKINPKNAVYVGDSASDITSARANGLKTAAVTYGYNTKEQLEETEPDYVLDSFEELKKLI